MLTRQLTLGDRPTVVEHINSIKVKPGIHQPNRIVLVDDLITSGTTMLGCANVLQKAFPNAEIVGFAAIRTMSNPSDFKQILDPCNGRIVLHNDRTKRSP